MLIPGPAHASTIFARTATLDDSADTPINRARSPSDKWISTAAGPECAIASTIRTYLANFRRMTLALGDSLAEVKLRLSAGETAVLEAPYRPREPFGYEW
ncbi:hypothetical protein GCM10020216_030200 [Nonomuraea helvata]